MLVFASAFDQINISRNVLQPSETPLIGFGGKGVLALGKIELPVTLGDMINPRTERIMFHIVDMYYCYNIILETGFLNTYHQAYLFMKLPAAEGIIIVFGNQQIARDIEKGITPRETNVHGLQPKAKKVEPLEAKKQGRQEVVRRFP